VCRSHNELLGAFRSLIALAGFMVLLLFSLPVTIGVGKHISDLPLAFALYVAFVFAYAYFQSVQVRRLVQPLTQLSNLGATGCLLKIAARLPLTHQILVLTPDMVNGVSDALSRLLPNLSPSDRALLDAEEHEVVRRLVLSDRRDVAVAALDAVRRFGDDEGVRCLERVAAGALSEKQRLKVYPGMRQRATAALEKIEERRRSEAAGGYLLRPSEADPAETLLRTPFSSSANSDDLLRASLEVPT
jgi:hypothetical protein